MVNEADEASRRTWPYLLTTLPVTLMWTSPCKGQRCWCSPREDLAICAQVPHVTPLLPKLIGKTLDKNGVRLHSKESAAAVAVVMTEWRNCDVGSDRR